MKKLTRKGFTLTELIVAMAIFSILMVFVLSIADPVSKIFKNASVAEKTYSYANNIQLYLQTHLEYAEDVVVATGDRIDTLGNKNGSVDSSEIYDLVEKFRQNHFQYTVMRADDVDETRWLSGQIHTLRLCNTGTDRGQIMHGIYRFDSNKPIDAAADLVQAETAELNPAFFNARDSRYNFSYALGSNKFVNVPVPTGGDSKEAYKALQLDRDGGAPNISSSSFAVSIVIDKGGKNNTGSVDVTQNVLDGDGNIIGTQNYRAFKVPATVQVAPINFTTINMRETGWGYPRPFKKNGTENIAMQPDKESYLGWGFATNDYSSANNQAMGLSLVSADINFDSDIYFIYALSDEMTPADASNIVPPET